MNKITKAILIAGILAILGNVVVNVHHARAQAIASPAFTATQILTNRAGPGHGAFIAGTTQSPFPVSTVRHVAQNSKGQFSIVQEWGLGGVNMRRIDYFDGTRLLIDDMTKTTVHKTGLKQTNEGGRCDGVFDGQVQGYDVVYNQQVDTLDDGEQITDQMWSAPKLGCHTLREYTLDMHEGMVMYEATMNLVNITIGDPDFHYFDTGDTIKGYTEVTHENWIKMATPYFNIQAGIALPRPAVVQ